MRTRYKNRHPLIGAIVGAISGLTGTVVMTQFQNVWNKISEEMHKLKTAHRREPAEEPKEDSTMKAAGKISEAIGRPLSRERAKESGTLAPLRFWRVRRRCIRSGCRSGTDSVRGINPVFAGAAYGAAVFLAAHEFAVPALKLSSNPLKEPIPEQIAEFVSHLIYGIGTALTYNGIKRLKG